MDFDIERALVVGIDFGTLSGRALVEPAAEDEVEAGARDQGEANA
jgi:ribulose kinase